LGGEGTIGVGSELLLISKCPICLGDRPFLVSPELLDVDERGEYGVDVERHTIYNTRGRRNNLEIPRRRIPQNEFSTVEARYDGTSAGTAVDD